jgi:3-isopropylmalate/(R)-2-methylmalate dehydratase large subunit
VVKIEDGPDVFIDRHFIHEVTSPVAFFRFERKRITVLYPERTFATADHNTPQLINIYQLKMLYQQIN